MSLKKIFHIGDIHIRNVNRHTEYRQVFEKMFAEIRKRGTDDALIYLAGDIVHAKLDMSPELISEVSWLFTKCAELCPTILIAGNHDCNMNNTDRMDALSPIVEALNLDNFYYLRDTQVFEYGEVMFSVFSIFDKRQNWIGGDSIHSANLKIALFHGPLDTSTTDVGYVVSSRHFKPEIFNGFDLALLGDIHKRQMIISNAGCKIAYPSSLVQQNFGESLNGHGFLVWDLGSRTYEEVDIPNDYGYYTLNVENGIVPDVTDMPLYPRLRVRLSKTDASDTKRVMTEIKMKYKVSDFTIIHTDSSRLSTGSRASKLEFDDISDITYQNALIADYVQRMIPTATDRDIAGLESINQEINNRIAVDDIHRNISWKPIKFTFDNMFSYGKGNVINFDKISGLMGLFAPNATGKSAIFSALTFCLFDKCDRTFRASAILNNRATSFTCQLQAQINGVDYFIKRDAKTVSKGAKVKVDVQFWKEEGGIPTSLNGTERRDTDSIIEQYFGRYEDFLLTALSVQGNNALFIDKSQTERKDLLAQFMGLTIFDKLYETASDDIKEVTTLIKNFKKTDFTTELAEKQNELKKKKVEFNQLDTEIKELETQKSELDSKIVELTKDIIPIDVILDIDTLEENEDKISIDIALINSSIIDREAKLLESIAALAELSQSIEDNKTINGKPIEVAKKEWDSHTDQVGAITHKIDLLMQSISANVTKLSHLEKHEYDPNCSFCMNNVFVKDAIATQEIVENQQIELTALRGQSKEFTDKAYALIEANSQYQTWTTLKTKYQKDIVIKEKGEAELKGLKTKKELYEARLKETKVNIKKYHKNESSILNNKKLNKEISDIKTKKNSLETTLADKKKQLLRITADTGSIKNYIDTTKAKMKEIKELETKNELYTFYLEAVKRDGIPYELIAKALPVIEDEINNILAQVVDFHIVMDMDGKNINAKIVYEDQEWALEMCSGMEKFISGLAIRVALINICNLPRPNFLIIDEGMGTLDSENLSSLYMMFSYLKTQFDFIILISHLESIRDVVEGFIEIKRIDGFSNVVY